ncbi:MAG TPA: leucine--tRNA ligase [Longimicrobiales bacterium]
MSDGNHETYTPAAIEEKWQRLWEERGTNTYGDEALAAADRPFYNLMMFPYPSAEGLHVGNIYAFTGADVYGRFRRLQGDAVFEPIGFDAFGIHSENYALKVGTHPMELIPKNIANFTRQLRRTGAMYDWNHTVDTTDPRYYRWTQWLFLQLYKAGLAEKREAPVNWCPGCHTVLANEQVIAGECERCGTAVEQRYLSQWFFRITDYAQRLLDDLSWIDWSETTKKAQENWIGRSEGAELRFPIARRRVAEDRHEPARLHAEPPVIRVFTTRPDTVFGATFMVLAPEHPLVDALTSDDQRAAVEAYRARIATMDVVARKKTDKEKTGVFTGGYCINPATGEEIPVWIADYVLMEYGTGAIMAVPGHDDRDFEFATKFALPIRRVVAEAADPEAMPGAPGAREDGTPAVSEAEALARSAAEPLTEAYTGPGVLVNSDRFNGMRWDEAKRAITDWLAERGLAEPRVNYRLHDWCISRQRYWGPPIPILYCDRCGTVPVPEADLPVVLPYVEDYKPDESGVSPLARVEEWYRVPCPECGGEARRETDVSDTFLDSAWYFLRYPSAGRDDVAFDRALTKKWLPVDMYIGGEEHAVLHLLYSRFITMVLHDLGHIDFEEPYVRFRKHGLIIKDGAKMSKSRGNVVVPDEYIERFGADAFRTYLMFLGPYQEGGDFRDQGLQGPYGFLSRLWDCVVPVAMLGDAPIEGALEQKLHATIRKVTEDLAELRYNTAIAAMMEYLNAVREGGRRANRSEVEPLIVLVAPFAPHIAEELWQRLGHERSIFERPTEGEAAARPAGWRSVAGGNWPVFDPEKATVDVVEFVVQVNGKVRARIPVERGIREDEARAAALADENVRRFVNGNQVRKVIFVPDRLINLVVA